MSRIASSFRSRRRRSARLSRDAVLTTGNVIASVFDLLSEVEEGSTFVEAFDVAYERGKKRRAAIKSIK